MNTQTVELETPGVMDRITGRSSAYETGKLVGGWSRYVEIRELLLKYRDDCQDTKQKVAALEMLMRLRSRYE